MRPFPRDRSLARIGAFVFLLVCGVVGAGGPTSVIPGVAVIKWNVENPARFPVRFALDQGTLGALINEEAVQLVREAFQKWEDVPSSIIQFQEAGPLEMDITVDNYDAFFDNQVRPENPIIFDHDGAIIDDVLGTGSRDSVLGFAGLRSIDTENREYESGWAVLNGLWATEGTFPAVVAHEVGHFIGLDHTQIHRGFARSISLFKEFVPLMFPFVFDGFGEVPLRDDIAWVSWLYPHSDFETNTGTMKGQIFRRGGSPFRGANVVAVQVSRDPSGNLIESKPEIVSVVSDFLERGDGSYEIPGLTPGEYVVFIEKLDDRFTGGSGVGPFDSRFTNFPKDYFSGVNESAIEEQEPNLQNATVLNVAPGETVEAVNLISNDLVNRLDLLQDDTDMLFEFPEGFSFPFFGAVYTSVWVNSDGNLTFERGDPGSEARDESRFLSGPPRIAPLFTDLNPEASGEVQASVENGAVTFTWADVPEFADEGTAPGNRFSVTLFATGDIQFTYDTVAVTPDPDDVQAVVGIVPGDSSAGNQTDLSEGGGFVRISGAPIYEVFESSSFDLEGQSVLFQTSQHELIFSFFEATVTDFSGYAVTNLSSEPANITIEGFSNVGEILGTGTIQVQPQGQVARLGRELLGIPFGTEQSGWIRMGSSTADVASFFQFGNGLSATQLTKLDGAVAVTTQSTVLFFTRLYDGVQTFPSFGLQGPKDAQTFISIANPNDQAVTLRLRLFAPTGQLIADVPDVSIPALGRLRERLILLFPSLPDTTRISDGYLRVDVTSGPGAAGFAWIEVEGGDTVLGVNASTGNAQDLLLFSAQLANGTDANLQSIFSSLKLVNTTEEPVAVTLRAFQDDGTEIFVLGNQVLSPAGSATLQRGVHELFNLGFPSQSALVTGSIQIEASAPGIVGDILFGDPGDVNTGRPEAIDFAAALPLHGQGFRRAVFSHVVNGSTAPADPFTATFTGIALFNPNPQTATITVEVFDRDGSPVGDSVLTLPANARLSQLVDEIVPQSAGLIGGYVVLTSTQPVVAQELFGGQLLHFLSAVPPRIIE